MRFFTSDQHFGHVNIINFCRRPFHSVDNMNKLLVQNWNEVVSPDDTVIVIGDFAMGQIKDTLPLAKQLNGKKTLICGNHDRPWVGSVGNKASDFEKYFKWERTYLENGFKIVSSGSIPIQLGGRYDAIMNHFPYDGDSHEEERFLDHRPVNNGMILLHGHTHSADRGQGNMVHVGVDAWDYYPVSEDTIVDILDERKELGQIDNV